ncbi:hypothetical protein B0H14DRAFT_619721 [Mycena olivaceomarginata]|nr:hypothetical protein B0H14DRAFT_619721 [Mycena olivaceomarginata]
MSATSHIQFFRLTPVITEKEKNKGPSPEEIRANIPPEICSGCGESYSGAEKLKNCAGCRAARYCSRHCQVSDWPTHKPLCGGSVSSTDIRLKLAKKLMANVDLMFLPQSLHCAGPRPTHHAGERTEHLPYCQTHHQGRRPYGGSACNDERRGARTRYPHHAPDRRHRKETSLVAHDGSNAHLNR